MFGIYKFLTSCPALSCPRKGAEDEKANAGAGFYGGTGERHRFSRVKSGKRRNLGFRRVPAINVIPSWE